MNNTIVKVEQVIAIQKELFDAARHFKDLVDKSEKGNKFREYYLISAVIYSQSALEGYVGLMAILYGLDSKKKRSDGSDHFYSFNDKLDCIYSENKYSSKVEKYSGNINRKFIEDLKNSLSNYRNQIIHAMPFPVKEVYVPFDTFEKTHGTDARMQVFQEIENRINFSDIFKKLEDIEADYQIEVGKIDTMFDAEKLNCALRIFGHSCSASY